MPRRPLPGAREVLGALLGLLGIVGGSVVTSLVLRATVGPGTVAGLPLNALPLLLVAYVLWLGRVR